MLDRITRPFALAACLVAPLSAVADDATPTPVDAATAEIPVSLDTLQTASVFMHEIDGFEVVVSTIVRDADGRRLAPPSNGRVAFARDESGVTFVVETWGAFGSSSLSCDGETITIADPVAQTYESWPLPECASTWLDDEEITGRFGPAAMHLLGIALDDGLASFRATGADRVVDLGPTRATVVPCRPVRDDESGGEMRLAFAADGPTLPLAVAVLLEDGGVVELEFHDWSLGRPAEDAMLLTPPAEWRQVAMLPRPSFLPAVESATVIESTDSSSDAVVAGAESFED